MAPGLAEAADQLYAVPAAEFMALRTRLVAEARAAKDRAGATAIGKLRKPSVAAALVNALVRSRPDLTERLVSVGEQLRAAQANLHGTALTALRPTRDDLIADVLGAVGEIAAAAGGGSLSGVAGDEVRDTIIAALASQEATEAVAAGHLTRSLHYSGFGEVDLADAVARTETGTLLRVIPGRRPHDDDGGPEATGERVSEPERTSAAVHADEVEPEEVEPEEVEPDEADPVDDDPGVREPESGPADSRTAESTPDTEQPVNSRAPEDVEAAIAQAGAAYAEAAAAVVAAKQEVAATSARVDAAKTAVADLTAAMQQAEQELEAAFAADADAREAVTLAVKDRQAAARRLASAQDA